MASLQWNPNWWLECEAAAQCEQLAALAEKPTDDAFGEPVFASSLSLLGIMITSPGTGSQALARSQKVKPRREREIWNPSDMIFVKMFTLANFGPVMFYPKARNSLE